MCVSDRMIEDLSVDGWMDNIKLDQIEIGWEDLSWIYLT